MEPPPKLQAAPSARAPSCAELRVRKLRACALHPCMNAYPAFGKRSKLTAWCACRRPLGDHLQRLLRAPAAGPSLQLRDCLCMVRAALRAADAALSLELLPPTKGREATLTFCALTLGAEGTAPLLWQCVAADWASLHARKALDLLLWGFTLRTPALRAGLMKQALAAPAQPAAMLAAAALGETCGLPEAVRLEVGRALLAARPQLPLGRGAELAKQLAEVEKFVSVNPPKPPVVFGEAQGRGSAAALQAAAAMDTVLSSRTSSVPITPNAAQGQLAPVQPAPVAGAAGSSGSVPDPRQRLQRLLKLKQAREAASAAAAAAAASAGAAAAAAPPGLQPVSATGLEAVPPPAPAALPPPAPATPPGPASCAPLAAYVAGTGHMARDGATSSVGGDAATRQRAAPPAPSTPSARRPAAQPIVSYCEVVERSISARQPCNLPQAVPLPVPPLPASYLAAAKGAHQARPQHLPALAPGASPAAEGSSSGASTPAPAAQVEVQPQPAGAVQHDKRPTGAWQAAAGGKRAKLAGAGRGAAAACADRLTAHALEDLRRSDQAQPMQKPSAAHPETRQQASYAGIASPPPFHIPCPVFQAPWPAQADAPQYEHSTARRAQACGAPPATPPPSSATPMEEDVEYESKVDLEMDWSPDAQYMEVEQEDDDDINAF